MATPLINPYNKYTGNGATTEFAISFPYLDNSYVHVYLRRAGEEEVELTSDDFEFVSATTIRFPKTGSSETVLGINDVLAIKRETPVENDYVFENQKRLFPEDVMDADDKSYQILQEQAEDLKRAVKTSPTSSVDPDTLVVQVERIYNSVDNIDALADDLSNIDSIYSALGDIDTVADNITDVNTVAGIATDISTVADNDTNITTVATNISDVSAVADDITKVAAVADDLTKIDAVYANATNIDTVADDLTNIDAVATDIANINAVAGDLTNIDAVKDNATNINAVAGNASNINAVAGNASNINAVAGNATNINAVNANKTNIDTVAGDKTNIDTVAGISANVSTVAGIASDVTAVKNNATNINAVAADLTNINAVAADLTNIDNASAYAAEAKQWAVGEPTEPSKGSAKYWAGQAAAGQVQADWTEADSTSKAYIKNKPTIDQSYNASSTNAQSGTAVAEALSAFETLPSQAGNSGKYLTTDGTDASWDNVKLVENAQDENTLGIWQGSQQEWEQAEVTDWRKWQTDVTVSTDKAIISGGVWVASNDTTLIYGLNNSGLAYGPWNNVTDSNVTSGTYGGGCIYINNTFIAYPSNSNTSGTCQKSSDGMAWESETYSGINYMAYNPKRWCTFNSKIYCINTLNNLYKTSDGLSWSSMNRSNVSVIACSDSRLVVAGYGASGTWIGLYYSDDDGDSWTTVYPGALSSYEAITALVYFNNKFILIGPTSYKVSTDNCVTWGDATAHNMSGVADNSPVAIINNRLVCFAANKMYYTTDGETWVEGITTGATPTSIAKTPGEDGIVFIQPGWYRGIVTFSSSSCYTTTTTPTTASTVYSAPNTTSALTITSVGTGTITLSDSQVYNRQAGGDTQTYQTAGSLYPNHLAFVDNVGVKIGNTLIANSTDTTEIEQAVENLESGKADKDLVNTGYITNCITQISQDINIELSNGTLTLKKGSKVYVPNGTGVFDEVTVSSDCHTATTVDNTWLVFYKNGTLEIRNVNVSTSGTSQPSGNWKAGYNTSTNKVSLTDGSGNLTTDYSLPVAIVTSSGGALTSIDKVFNGFGYIGSTIFSLPGIKALIPMGRNEDGSMINGEITTTTVLTNTETTTGARRIMLGSSRLDNYVNVYYNEDKNILWNSTNSMIQRVDCGSFYRGTDGTITLFASKNPLNILGYSDRAMITGWAMPSNTYDDLTLGANNAYYTAPADGYVLISKNGNGGGQYVNVYVVPSGSTERIVGFAKYDVSSNGIVLAGTVPVSKGQRFTVIYNASGNTNYFRFVYANGSAWEKA